MVFPTCSRVSSSTGLGTDCYINIAYNQQLKLCSSSTDSGLKKGVMMCRPHDDLCTADPNFKFNFSDLPDNDVSQLPFRTHFHLTAFQSCSFSPASLCHHFIPLHPSLCLTQRSARRSHYLSSWVMPTSMGSPTSLLSLGQGTIAFRAYCSLSRVRRMLSGVRRVGQGGAGGMWRGKAQNHWLRSKMQEPCPLWIWMKTSVYLE